MKNSIIITIVCLLLGLTTVHGQRNIPSSSQKSSIPSSSQSKNQSKNRPQEFHKYEVSIHAFGGLHTAFIGLNSNGTTPFGRIGGGGGIGYNLNINETWSIGTGIDISSYSATMKFPELESFYTEIINMGGILESTTFTANATNYSETLSTLQIELPVTLRYTLHFEDRSLSFAGGFKFGLPLRAGYKASAENLKTEMDVEFENQTYEGYDQLFSDGPMKESGEWKAKMAVQVTFETAYRFALNETQSLSIGLYFNYGLNNLKSESNQRPVIFVPFRNVPYATNSIMNSYLTSSIRPVAFGVRLRFHIGLQK